VPALLVKVQAIKPSLTRLDAYYRTKCHFKM
jgi:hypothetical protein